MAGFRGRVYRDLVINGTWNFACSRFNLLFLVHVVFFSRLIVSHVTIVDYSPLDQRMDKFLKFRRKIRRGVCSREIRIRSITLFVYLRENKLIKYTWRKLPLIFSA